VVFYQGLLSPVQSYFMQFVDEIPCLGCNNLHVSWYVVDNPGDKVWITLILNGDADLVPGSLCRHDGS